jgi:hypothetical protein
MVATATCAAVLLLLLVPRIIFACLTDLTQYLLHRDEQLQARHQELQGQLEELTSIQNRAVQALQAAAAGSGQHAQQPAPQPAPPTAQPSISQQAAPSTAGPAAPAAPATGAGAAAAAGPSHSTPQPVPFRTPAAPAAPNASGARGLAQVLEPSPAGSDARAGRITSAMFGSAMQAAMAAAQQVTSLESHQGTVFASNRWS